MGTRNNRNNDHYLLETNFDEDGPLTTLSHAQGANQQQNGGGDGDLRNQIPYRSTTSIDRYSDSTLHGTKKKGDDS